MNVLVTGATGFIGRAVVRSALERGHRVTALVRDAGKAKQILYAHPQLALVEGALADFKAEGGCYDRLIHLAWDLSVKFTDPASLTNNLALQFDFLSRMVASGLTDITVAGTCLEYGMQEGSLKEDAALQPVTYYGLAKTALFDMLAILQRDENFSLKWLRYFYVYGVEQRAQSLYPQLLAAIARKDKTFNMSPGDQVRDFISIEALAHNTVVIVEQTAVTGAINVGSGRGMPVVEFVKNILHQHKHEMKLNCGFYPYPTYEPHAFYADTSRLRSILGSRVDEAAA